MTVCIWLAIPLTELAMLLPTTDITTSGQCRDWNVFPNQAWRRLFGVLTFIFEYLGPSSVLTLCYSSIYAALKRRGRRHKMAALLLTSVTTVTPVSPCPQDTVRRDVLKTLVTVVLVYFVCNSTKPVLYLVYNCGFTFNLSGVVYQIASLANFANSAVNPFIYAFQYAAFQSEFRKLWRTARSTSDVATQCRVSV